MLKWYFVAYFILEVFSVAQAGRIEDENISNSNQKYEESCEAYYENRMDSREVYGVLRIPNPNLPKSETKIIFTVPVRLRTVSISRIIDQLDI